MKLADFCLLALILAAGCGGGASLTGGGDGQDHLLPDDGSVDDQVVDGAGEDGGMDLDSAGDIDLGDDGGGDDARDDDGAICPVWAVPLPTGGTEDGSEARPFGGLDRALEGRGACDTIVLRGGTPETPFDAAVNIDLAVGETLTIEGESAVEALAELDARDDIGLFVTGEGTLVLRHLAVRWGWGPTGGCLDAEVAVLRMEDTEFSGCRADVECGVRVSAENIEISNSKFTNNQVMPDADPILWPPGVVCLDGPPDTAYVLVERCRFEGNDTDFGSALAMQAQTLDAVVRDCVFTGNHAGLGPAALAGTLGELSHNRFEANEVERGWGIVGIEGTPETRVVHNLFVGNSSYASEMGLKVSRGIVANNLFVRNTCRNTPDVIGCRAAVYVTSRDNVDLRNNTFVGNDSEEGIAHLAYDSAFGQARSNLFVGGAGAGAVGMVYSEWGESAEMTWNAWWDVPEPVWGEGIHLGEGNIEADPFFDGGDDFHLGADSAAIDAGDPDPLLADPDGTRNDIGAFGGPEGDWTPLPEGGAP